MTAPVSQPGAHVLVVGPSWVGDMVMAQSLFKLLARRDAVIDVLAPPWSLPLLDAMPEVRRAIEAPFEHGQLRLAARRRLGRQLTEGGYHQAVVLPNSWKSALVPCWARIPRRTGFLGEQRWGLLNDIRRDDRQRLTMTVQRFAVLASPASENPPTLADIPPPRLVTDPATVAAAVRKINVDPAVRPVLALCPGAEYGPAKRWPPDHFAAVARTYLQAGWQVWLLGSHKDLPASDAVASRCDGQTVNLTGRTTLAEVIALLAQAHLVISNDSGLMHVAAALDRPLVALYGSSDPAVTPPLNEGARILSLGLRCSPCFARECPLGHLDCLRQLLPEQVLDAGRQLVANAP